MKITNNHVLSALIIGAVAVTPPVAMAETKVAKSYVSAPACRSSDFRSFLEWNLRSSTFDKNSVAATVRVRRGNARLTKTRAQYKELPIALMDNSYITSQSARGSSRNWENVRIGINQAQDGRVRVDWVRIRSNGQVDEEAISQNNATPYGPRGHLIFQPTANCWQLTDDNVGGAAN